MAVLLQIQYQKFSQVGSEAHRAHDAMKQVRQTLADHVDILKRDGWQADAADDFYQAMAKDIFPGLDRLITALDHTESTVARTIQIYRRAEQNTLMCIRDVGGKSVIEAMVDRAKDIIEKTRSQSQTPDKIFTLLGNIKGISNAFDALTKGEPLELYDLLDIANSANSDGSPIEGLANWVFGTLIEEGVEQSLNALSAGAGAVAFLVNDVIQLDGSITKDFAVFTRELFLGDDPTSKPYQFAQESTEKFANIYKNADLRTPIELLAQVITTATVKPYLNQLGRIQESFNQGDYTTMLKEGLILTSGMPNVIANEVMRNPDYNKDLLVDTVGFGGDTLDFVVNVPRLITAKAELTNNMVWAVNERMIDTLPMSNETRSALHQSSSAIHDSVNTGLTASTIAISPMSAFSYLVDFGDEGRRQTEKIFDHIQGSN